MSSISSDIVTIAQARRTPAVDAKIIVSFPSTNPKPKPRIDNAVIKIDASAIFSADFIVFVLI